MPGPDAVVPDAPVWRIIAGRIAPLAGAIACTVGCMSFPVVLATLSAAGIGFLRTDWLLIPLDVVSIAFVLRGFVRARTRHRRNGPLMLAVSGVVALLVGGRSTGNAAGPWLAVGTGILLATTVWDHRGGGRLAPVVHRD